MSNKILKDIYSHQDKEKAEVLSGFFKTKKGEYGEGDVFWGITVPVSRSLALKYRQLSLVKIAKLIRNEVHEVRLIALLILVEKFENSNIREREKIVKFYLKNTKYINNWDLVDLSAPKILGEYFLDKNDKGILLKLAKSGKLWEERIAILTTFAFLRKGIFKWTFQLARMFLDHQHDLIHKATGWMLREIGKRDESALKKFLNNNKNRMPRTMLRYAIEKFPEKTRKKYLKN